MTDWQDIASAPKDGTQILAANALFWGSAAWVNGRWCVSCADEVPWEGEGDTGGLMDLPFDPTHYAIPNPPIANP